MNSMNNCTRIWDFQHGEVICAETGEVIDRIYDYSSSSSTRNTEEYIHHYEDDVLYKKFRKRIRTYKHLLRKYMEIRRRLRKKHRKNYMVDYDGLLNGKPRSISSIRNIIKIDGETTLIIERGRKILESYGIHEVLASGRTERSMRAIEYIIGYIDVYGEFPSRKKIVELFNIAPSTYQRIKKLIHSISGLGKTVF